ncbi:insulin-like growth factor-binding protein complex acid labile subunit isoform X1 [Agrilus planipennis]|uniref:Insulin-like growth factor-binding protein complex acid labile subunit isoform X1 n=1 Tax=Agrilus planipennis TaxID=224129 RepID=A0A1W4XLT9_AGRPL|nr:insulin-like growth factor-binding protein complex acid labile subunit isoform X1 [Agrilus planipennis]
MFFTMKGVLATILFILGCRINASIPGCQEIERSSTRYFDGYVGIITKTTFDLKCYGINSLPSKELQYDRDIYMHRVLVGITFSDSYIKNVPSLSFYEFPTIQYLNMDYCGINRLDANCFLGLKELSRLQLSNNNISNIGVGTLSHLFNLNYLDLSNNSLKVVDKDAFQSLTLVKELLLNNNKFEVLPDELFSTLHNIRNIDLSWNNLNTLSVNLFRNLTSLQTLKLNNNLLKTLPPTIFKDLSTTDILDMSYNLLTNISYESLLGLESLISLNISNNQLITLDSQYNGSEKLNTSSEGFSHFCPNETYVNTSSLSPFLGLNSLKELNLEGNKISKIGNESLKGSIQLRNLYMSNNELYEIHEDAFQNVPSLMHLSLDNNNLETINSSTFFNLRELRTLILNNNQIRILPVPLFKDLKSLSTLSLSNNLLTYIPYGLLSQLKQLSILNVSNNELVELNAISYHSLNDLSVLDITRNNIRTVDANQLMSVLVNLRTIHVDRNSWNCVELFNIISRLQASNVNIDNGNTFDTENIHGIPCSPVVNTTPTSQTTSFEASDFQKYISNVLMNINETLLNINSFMEKDRNIQECILNNSRIMVKLQQSVIQQLTKNERKERHLHSNTLNKTDIQSKEEINGTPGCDPNSSNNV